MSFEKSLIYKEALKKYQSEIFKSILKPINIIVYERDIVYLFYNQNIVEDIYKQIKKIYQDNKNNIETYFPIHLGYNEPTLITTTFMGIKYKVVRLWYDNEEPPIEFQAI